MVDPAHKALLDDLSTDESPHSGRTLFEHLSGTQDLLQRWGADDDVATAGLFHSIYGTSAYRTESASFDQRDQVRAVIGERAEALAHAFCVTKRGDFVDQVDADRPVLRRWADDGTVEVTSAQVADLLEIEAANVVEQLAPEKVTDQQLDFLRRFLEVAGHRLSQGARDAVTGLVQASEERRTSA